MHSSTLQLITDPFLVGSSVAELIAEIHDFNAAVSGQRGRPFAVELRDAGGAPVLLQCNGTETYSTAAWPAGRPAEGMASADGAGGAPGEAIRAKGSSPTALAAHFARAAPPCPLTP